VISRENYKEIVFPLPASDLLYVGRSTANKLRNKGVFTIGDIANMDVKYLESWLGKNGVMIWRYASGYDTSPVAPAGFAPIPIKSIGNSVTTTHDLITEDDIKITLYALAESIASRMREDNYRCNTVQIWVRDNELESYTRQRKLPYACCTSSYIADIAYALYQEHQNGHPIRSMGVRGTDLTDDAAVQLSMMPDIARAQKQEDMEKAIDDIRRRFGHYAIQRAVTLKDKSLAVDPKGTHIIFPASTK
jgi:DNA polymerase-4